MPTGWVLQHSLFGSLRYKYVGLWPAWGLGYSLRPRPGCWPGWRSPGCPGPAAGVRVRSKTGLWWVSVPVLDDSVPKEVTRGETVCSMGSPPDVRVALKVAGRV